MERSVLGEPLLHDEAKTVLKDGMKNLGVYHHAKPLTLNKKGEIESQSFRLLYYYHNRLDHYQLDRHITWKTEMVEGAIESMAW